MKNGLFSNRQRKLLYLSAILALIGAIAITNSIFEKRLSPPVSTSLIESGRWELAGNWKSGFNGLLIEIMDEETLYYSTELSPRPIKNRYRLIDQSTIELHDYRGLIQWGYSATGEKLFLQPFGRGEFLELRHVYGPNYEVFFGLLMAISSALLLIEIRLAGRVKVVSDKLVGFSNSGIATLIIIGSLLIALWMMYLHPIIENFWLPLRVPSGFTALYFLQLILVLLQVQFILYKSDTSLIFSKINIRNIKSNIIAIVFFGFLQFSLLVQVIMELGFFLLTAI